MDDMKIQHASDMYAKLCESMDMLDWKYTKIEDELKIECSAQGEDLPMELVIKLHPDLQLLNLFSHLPFTVPEDKRLDFAVAISIANNKMVDGCFDYDLSDGHIFFRMTNSFIDVELGFETLRYLIFCSCATIDKYNDKFLMLAKGMFSLEQFMESEA